MNWTGILELCVASILVNNIVLTRLIGVCPLCGTHKKLSDALGMGLSAIVVMGVASTLAWVINRHLLLPLNVEYLQTFVFILVIMSLALIGDMALMKLAPGVYERAGKYLPALASNCAVIAVALVSAQANPVTHKPFSLVEAFVNGIATGAGFTLALVLMSSLQERLEFADIPRPLKGLPAAFLGAGLLSLAFLGFSGLHLLPGFGG
jgi:electron transport complex protein RnfA